MHRALAYLVLVAGVLPAAAAAAGDTLRIATFNASLNRPQAGALLQAMASGQDAQARAVAAIVQRVRPDILLLQEFDHDAAGAALAAFQANYLGRGQEGQAPLAYPHVFIAESNTGQPSGFDLDNDGRIGGGGDALGFGEFPGQYAMALLSRYPLDTARARTFRKLPWREMPGALLPDDPATAAPADWYSPEELAQLPLSSKSHWDVPVRIGRRTLHLLISHPTPPTFDGAEDRNGRRNHDEIRFWSDYLTPGLAGYIRDDAGRRGGFAGGDFLIMGDLNSDPVDGDSLHAAINRLLTHAAVNADFVPASRGGARAAIDQGGANASQRGDPRFDTADFSDRVPGNLRVDYLLPSKSLQVCGGGVFWPEVSSGAPPPSDHHLVWLDLRAGAARCPPDSDPTTSAAAHPGR